MILLQLQYFITIAETGNLTRATRQAYTSQPTINHQIQMLGEELGYSSFNRSSKPLRLTGPGQILYEGMKEAISQINDIPEKARIISEGKGGALSISFQFGYFSGYMSSSTINKLRETGPTLQTRSNKLFLWDQIRGLKSESIDVVVGLEFSHQNELGFTARELKKIGTLIVISTNRKLVKKETLEYNDLCGKTFFLTAPDGYQMDRIFKHHFCLDDVRQVEVSSSESAYFKVLSDNGLMISNPYDPMLLNNPHYHTTKFDFEYADFYVCVTNPDNANPATQLFLDLTQTDCEFDKRRSALR